MFQTTAKRLMEGHSAYVALEQRVNTRQKGIIQRHLSPYDVDIRGNGFRQIYRLGLSSPLTFITAIKILGQLFLFTIFVY